MTYEEKLDLVIKAIREAEKYTRKEHYYTKLYYTSDNGLKEISLSEIHDILLQLQDDEKIITAQGIPTALKSAMEQATEGLNGAKHYFTVDILEGFDNWYESYLFKEKGMLGKISFVNLLKIYDVLIDIDQELQIANSYTVLIPLLPQIVKFSQLFPQDDIGMRNRYKEFRWDAIKYLKEKGAVSDMKFIEDYAYGKIEVTIANLNDFNDFYNKVEVEYKKRYNASKASKSENKTEKDAEEKPLVPKEQLKNEVEVSYDNEQGVLKLKDKEIKLQKDSFRANLMALLLKDEKSRKKRWSWDEIIEIIEKITDTETIKNNKKRFYPACDGISKLVAQKTGITDLLLFNKSTVQINSKYL